MFRVDCQPSKINCDWIYFRCKHCSASIRLNKIKTRRESDAVYYIRKIANYHLHKKIDEKLRREQYTH
jgi:hypothetical protein